MRFKSNFGGNGVEIILCLHGKANTYLRKVKSNEKNGDLLFFRTFFLSHRTPSLNKIPFLSHVNMFAQTLQ